MFCALFACTLAFQHGPVTTPIQTPPAGTHTKSKPSSSKKKKKTVEKTAPAQKPVVVASPYTDNPSGYGNPVKVGDMVVIHFLVKKKGGDNIADSKKRGLPYTMRIGDPGNDPLLDMVVKGMKVGAVRTGTVAAKDAYGVNGAPPLIGSNDILFVTVTLLRRGEK